jgi:hypothetical protein
MLSGINHVHSVRDHTSLAHVHRKPAREHAPWRGEHGAGAV